MYLHHFLWMMVWMNASTPDKLEGWKSIKLNYLINPKKWGLLWIIYDSWVRNDRWGPTPPGNYAQIQWSARDQTKITNNERSVLHVHIFLVLATARKPFKQCRDSSNNIIHQCEFNTVSADLCNGNGNGRHWHMSKNMDSLLAFLREMIR